MDEVHTVASFLFCVTAEKKLLFSPVTPQLFWVEDSPKKFSFKLRVGRLVTQKW